jgi:hypothetical protein
MARVPRNPADRDLEWYEEMERRLRALEQRTPRLIVLTADDGARVEVGVLDGTGLVGVRVYDHSGALVWSQTAT